MKFTRHPWGVFKREYNHREGRWMPDRLVGNHKSAAAAEASTRDYRDEYYRRLTKAERNPQ